MSADGKISTNIRKQVRISGDNDFARVDRLRADADAVMVGIGTVLADDPSLTIKSGNLRRAHKEKYGYESPIRIVVDSMARTPIEADIFNRGNSELIIAVCEQAPIQQVKELKKKATIITAGNVQVDLNILMSYLHQKGIHTLMVEGGATLNCSLVSQGLVDEIYTYIGAVILGGEKAPTLVDGIGFSRRRQATGLELISIEKIDDGVLLKWRVEQNPR